MVALALTLASPAPAREEAPRAAYLLTPRSNLAPPTTPTPPTASADADPAVPTDVAEALRSGLADVATIEKWMEWMSADGSDLSVLFGVPAEADRAAVELGSKAVLRLSQSATRKLEAAIAAFDKSQSQQGGADDAKAPDPMLAETAARAVHARTVLLPLRAARSMCLAAAVEPDTERRAKLAESAVMVAANAEPVSPWADAERSFLMGLGGLVGTPATGAGTGDVNATRAALEHLAAAKRTITDPDAPRGLTAELADDIALASVLGIARAPDGARADAAKLLDRVIEQPGIADSELARIAAAELRLRLLGGGGLTISTPEAALSGFAKEFDRALRDDRDPSRALQRLFAAARRGVRGAEGAASEGTTSTARLPTALAIADEAITAPRESVIVAAATAVKGLAQSSAWRRILTLSLVQAEPTLEDAPARLALARTAADLLDSTPDASDQRRVLAAARQLLAPLGPEADLDLSERVFTLSHERAGPDGSPSAAPPRVTAWRAEWGLKEVHEARAARAAAVRNYEEALQRLLKSDALAVGPSFTGRRCAECWWSLMDALLRDADALESKGELLDKVIDHAEAALGDWAEFVGASESAAPQDHRDGKLVEESLDREAIRRRLHPIQIDLTAQRGRAAEAAAALRHDVDARTPAESLVLAGAALAQDGTMSALLRTGLGRLEQPQRGAWALRVCDRAWARIRPLTRGFIDARSGGVPKRTEAQVASSAALRSLVGFIDDIPHDAQAAVIERCAWGLLTAGDAKDAAALFERATQGAGKRVDLLVARGEAMIAAGDDASAFSVFRDVAAAAPPRGEYAGAYFHAWARMLEILSRQNADGSKTETIRREARRLMLLEPGKACPECAAKIEAAAK
ncbi:MAG: hypothetical protein ACKVZJ_03495 [Phycisphaerales bacterium]